MAWTVGAKLGGVAALALASIVALEWALREDEKRQTFAAAADSEARRVVADLGVARPLQAATVTARTVVLCDRPGVVPEAAAEWQILSDGEWVVRRPPPLPTAPVATEVPAFAVALPVRDLSDLDARARASLIDFLSVAWNDRPVAPERLLLQGIGGDQGDRQALLGWLR